MKGSLITSFLWPTESEWHCTFCEQHSDHIFCNNWQLVSDIAHCVKGSLITSVPMTNSKWVTLHMLWKAVSSHHSYGKQGVSGIVHLVKAVSSHFFPLIKQYVSHITHLVKGTHHIISYDQKLVSDIEHFIKGRAVSSHLFLWPIGSEWHYTLCEWQSCDTFFYYQQPVSDIAHCVKGSSITSFPMTNSKWVTLHILSNTAITSFSMTNRQWVALHILWKAVSSHPFLSWTGSEWHCMFCGQGSHHILSYDRQLVSNIVHFVKGSLTTAFPMTNRQWVMLHIL